MTNDGINDEPIYRLHNVVVESAHDVAKQTAAKAKRIDDVDGIPANVGVGLVRRVDERVDAQKLPGLWVVVAADQ
jgi:hypothetical protein